MTIKKSSYIIRLGDAISQFFNVLLLNGDPNYSISGESYRNDWRYAIKVIDFLFLPFEKEHCKKAFEHDVMKAKLLLAEMDEINFRS
jgi:hypothetical protein